MRLSSLSIMLPAFNEERIIGKTIDSCERAAQLLTADYEILVVDDGSRDRTREILRQISGSNPYIKVIFLPHHMGYGKALSTGFYNARKEFIFYTDSDGPIDIFKELPKAVSLISEDADAVIGYRMDCRFSPLRKGYSVFYNFMNRTLLGIKARDVNFSCKLFRRRVFDRFRLYSNSVFVDAELLSNLDIYGFKVKEFPAVYIARAYGKSNFDSVIYASKVFMEMIFFWVKRRLFRGNLKKQGNV